MDTLDWAKPADSPATWSWSGPASPQTLLAESPIVGHGSPSPSLGRSFLSCRSLHLISGVKPPYVERASLQRARNNGTISVSVMVVPVTKSERPGVIGIDALHVGDLANVDGEGDNWRQGYLYTNRYCEVYILMIIPALCGRPRSTIFYMSDARRISHCCFVDAYFVIWVSKELSFYSYLLRIRSFILL